ncbi:hypothetical protein BRARA_G00755 [Brassica rapa]|uniref:LOB domain-containing protein n=1 Tax=Brassica campestris TaxID=3711 RepID=A0A397YN25_BRACM|nr:hypothetical protein BRARA_G00755 [Brassica rapa]CAG7901596.1 unnamed protein product [Brassica rapa]VDC97089.1 unnamed protein product [Brassica rapa]
MEALGTDTKHGRCCVCMVKNKICTRKCEFAAYFPNEMQDDYEAATKLFGTQNIIRMMKLAAHEQKHLLASSILKEGAAWTDDNIGGGYGVIQKLRWEIELHEASLSKIRMKISEEKKQLVLLSNQYI